MTGRDNTNREKVLQSIRNALLDARGDTTGIDMVSNVFQPYGTETDIVFAETFTANGGDFIYCTDEAEFLSSLALYMEQQGITRLGCIDPDLTELVKEEGIQVDSDPESPKASITTAELLVARTGTVIVSSARHDARPFVYPEYHLVLAFASQVRPDIHPALRSLIQKYKGTLPPQLTMISGAASSAAIDPERPVRGQGPGRVAVFLIDDKSYYG